MATFPQINAPSGFANNSKPKKGKGFATPGEALAYSANKAVYKPRQEYSGGNPQYWWKENFLGSSKEGPLLGNVANLTEVDYWKWANPKNLPDKLLPSGELDPTAKRFGLTAKELLTGALKEAEVPFNPKSKKFKKTLREFRKRNNLAKGEFIAPNAVFKAGTIENAYGKKSPYGSIFMDQNIFDYYNLDELAGFLDKHGWLSDDDRARIEGALEARANPNAAKTTKQQSDFDKAMKDPTTQWFLNEALGGFRSETAQLKEQLANLYTGTYGQTGAVKQFDTQSLMDQRRLAAEMAARGTLQSGAYAGGQRGLGTLQQQTQAAQRADIEKGYSSQTSPEYLFERGLARNPDGTVRELVEGETVTWEDPATGQQKSMVYSWMNTSFGREAKQAALQQWMQKQLSGVTSVI